MGIRGESQRRKRKIKTLKQLTGALISNEQLCNITRTLPIRDFWVNQYLKYLTMSVEQ